MQCCSLPMSMNSYCYQESQVLDSESNFMIVNIPIWDATINRICVNDESNTKHLQLHAMLVAAYVHEFILLSRISSLGKRKQFYDVNLLSLGCDYQQNLCECREQRNMEGISVFSLIYFSENICRPESKAWAFWRKVSSKKGEVFSPDICLKIFPPC